ncbi:hypothetical protein QJQ45_030021, partial [Haematococcus lacustris]
AANDHRRGWALRVLPCQNPAKPRFMMFVGLLRSASCGGLCQVSGTRSICKFIATRATVSLARWNSAGMGLRLSSVASCSNRDFSTDIVAITNKGLKQGPGGRSSVSGIVATIFGGSGFLGSYVTNELAKRGSQVIVPHRSTENAVQHIKQMGDLGQVILLPDFHLCDEEMVSRAIHRSNVVINMVGQRTETMNYTYEDVHVQWPQRLGRWAGSGTHGGLQQQHNQHQQQHSQQQQQQQLQAPGAAAAGRRARWWEQG